MTNAATEEPLSGTVIVYGLRQRHRAVRLINALAALPCYPSTLFRIDQQGRFFGATDQLRKPACIYYIHVINWCDRNKGLPVISCTLRPQRFSRSMAKQATSALVRFNAGVRNRPPMKVEVDIKEHAALHAKMTLAAS